MKKAASLKKQSISSELCNSLLVDKKTIRVSEFLTNVIPEIPVEIYLATKYDRYRKQSSSDLKMKGPNSGGVGLWELLEQSVSQNGNQIDKTKSFYVGDAAGRKSDHSDGDKRFAEMVGIEFKTPEQFFEE